MEKTRHLSMTEAEKERKKEADFTRRLQGLLQQYADGAFSANSLLEQVSKLAVGVNVSETGQLTEAVIGRIDPDRDNDRWFDLLVAVASDTVEPLREILAEHREKKAFLRQSAEKQLMGNLSRGHGIRGSAVSPNPKSDSDYREKLAALQAETNAAVDAVSAAQVTGKRK
jgi:hypothetical protein